MKQPARFAHAGIGGLALGVVLVLVPGIALAEEVVVRNDSVEAGDVVIVGDFVPGEQASTWLTSPCDGSIVAVQIVWLEGTPGHGQSLEEAIHIFASGSFPNPGAELELLEGPVLTPGFVNEFRYLDEAQTLPLDVPVNTGQTFVVSLEFANPTDVGGGGPSVVRDLNGCQSGRNALYIEPGLWANWCALHFPPKGDLAIRAVVDCQDPTGACCDPIGFCTDHVEVDACQDTGETFFEGQLCSDVTCPEPQGACCDGLGGCLYVEQDFCEGVLNWYYGGGGTTCDDPVCDLGACCMPDGSCQNVIDADCTDLGGDYQGAGTTCDAADCPQPLGACCLGPTCVPGQTEANCDSVSGSWMGAATSCTPNPCLGPACTCGDVNGSGGPVDLADFAAFANCFGLAAPAPPECSETDFICSDLDGNGEITLNDFARFAVLFGLSTTSTPPNCE